jgi:hypothetical protein
MMESFIRNISEIDAHGRRSLERVLGFALHEHQQLVIQIVNLDVHMKLDSSHESQKESDNPILPEWCDVYQDLSDTDKEGLEQTILQRVNLTRLTD